MAEEELAEISIEQQVLKEMSAKHHQKQQQSGDSGGGGGGGGGGSGGGSGGGGGKKSKQPISLNIADMMLEALQVGIITYSLIWLVFMGSSAV